MLQQKPPPLFAGPRPAPREGLFEKSPSTQKLFRIKQKRDCMLSPYSENVRSLFSLPLDLYFHFGKDFNQSPFYSPKPWHNNASIREGGRPLAVEGACASKFFLIRCGYRAQTLWMNSDFRLRPFSSGFGGAMHASPL